MLFSLFCSSHDDHRDLFWDLNIFWESVMWYITSNITGLARKINSVARWERTLFRLGVCFSERKNKCWATLCLYNGWHYDYVHWNKLICIFVTINYLLFNFIRGWITSASTLVLRYWWPRHRIWEVIWSARFWYWYTCMDGQILKPKKRRPTI